MSDYIKRDDVVEILERYDKTHVAMFGKPIIGITPMAAEINDLPAADVVEQKHGKWKKAYLDHEAFGIRPTVVYCSECNLIGYWEPKYCPNCGARMDGE